MTRLLSEIDALKLDAPPAPTWFNAKLRTCIAMSERGEGRQLAEFRDALLETSGDWRRQLGPSPRGEAYGGLRVFAMLVAALVEQAVDDPSVGRIGAKTIGARMLRVLEDRGELSGSRMRAILNTRLTEISRTGRRLSERGLVSRSRVGREAWWSITPRGRAALDEIAARYVREASIELADLAPPPDVAARWRQAYAGEHARALPVPGHPEELFSDLMGERRSRSVLTRQLLTWRSIQGFAAHGIPEVDVLERSSTAAERRANWETISRAVGGGATLGTLEVTPPAVHALARLSDREGNAGMILIDVPRAPEVFRRSVTLRSARTRQAAQEAVADAFAILRIPGRIPTVDNRLPDWLHRLVLVARLRHAGVHAWAAHVCFIDDPRRPLGIGLPTTQDAWEHGFAGAVGDSRLQPETLAAVTRLVDLPLSIAAD